MSSRGDYYLNLSREADYKAKEIRGTSGQIVTLLEICLRERNREVRPVKCGRIEIGVWKAIICIKYILNSTLDIEELMAEIMLCETVI